jgi:ubiquitin-protein ligase
VHRSLIRIDSKVTHLNIKEAGHICASILDTETDYTSTYTLKGVAIQLLGFFSSDRIQQVCSFEGHEQDRTDNLRLVAVSSSVSRSSGIFT